MKIQCKQDQPFASSHQGCIPSLGITLNQSLGASSSLHTSWISGTFPKHVRQYGPKCKHGPACPHTCIQYTVKSIQYAHAYIGLHILNPITFHHIHDSTNTVHYTTLQHIALHSNKPNYITTRWVRTSVHTHLHAYTRTHTYIHSSLHAAVTE